MWQLFATNSCEDKIPASIYLLLGSWFILSVPDFCMVSVWLTVGIAVVCRCAGSVLSWGSPAAALGPPASPVSGGADRLCTDHLQHGSQPGQPGAHAGQVSDGCQQLHLFSSNLRHLTFYLTFALVGGGHFGPPPPCGFSRITRKRKGAA